MAKHLTQRNVARIIEILDGWRGDVLSWELLCRACRKDLGSKPCRQTLYRNERIRSAFTSAKVRRRDIRSKLALTPPSLDQAAQRIERLTVENVRLCQENSAYRERFVRWQYNAHVHGLTEQDLNRALPSKSK
jgi:hypothetical protein